MLYLMMLMAVSLEVDDAPEVGLAVGAAETSCHVVHLPRREGMYRVTRQVDN